MVKRINQRLLDDYPDFSELSYLADLSEVTWRKWGLSIVELSQLDRWQLELIQVVLTA